jgi:hypothetical protein
VVKFYDSIDSVTRELPAMLRAEDESQPKHIQFDIAYTPEQVQMVREACGGADAKVAWYWAPMPEGMTMPPLDTFDENQLDVMTNFVAAKLKKAMNEVVEAGKEGVDGVYQM